MSFAAIPVAHGEERLEDVGRELTMILDSIDVENEAILQRYPQQIVSSTG